MSAPAAGRVGRLVRKLRGRSLDEVRVRGAQALAAWRERAGRDADALSADPARLAERLAAGAPRDPAALLAAFRARAGGQFVPGLADPAATAAAVAAADPAAAASAVARAERVLAGHFDLLGYESLDYGRPVDWHRDPVAGRRAPADAHWSRVPYLDHAAVGDHKVVWEVNRQQYLAALGQAWLHTGEARFADAFAAHVDAWLDANPPKRGINWASSLEVAFRAMAWCWALHLFRDAPQLTPARYARVLAALHVHARHLETFLSTYFSPNTHLTGEALGLVHVGALFPELAGARRWLGAGLGVWATWLPRQVRPDGTYFEQATQYHRYTAEFALHLHLLGAGRGWPAADAAGRALGGLADVLLHLARADGTIPLLGDDDGGRLAQLDGLPPHDVRGLLAQLGAALDRDDLRRAAGGEAAAALWLLGPGAVRPEVAPGEPPASRAFPDGGLYVLRDASGLHAVVDAGPHGAFNGGHAHADGLALVASAGARHLLVDAGTFSYPGPERNAFRGPAAHNVVLVDGEGASRPAADPFQWARAAGARARAWHQGPGFAYLDAAEDACAGDGATAEHRREVLLLHGLGWLVRDRVALAGAHQVAARWHLAPDLTAELPADASAGVVLRDAAGRAVGALWAAGRAGDAAAGAWRAEPAWVSPRYGARVPSVALAWEQQGAGAHDVLTAVLPAPAGGAPSVERVACDGPGRAYRVASGGGPHALVLVSDAPGATLRAADAALGPVATDAAWAWVVGGPDRAAEAGRVGGGFLQVADTTILAGAAAAAAQTLGRR